MILDPWGRPVGQPDPPTPAPPDRPPRAPSSGRPEIVPYAALVSGEPRIGWRYVAYEPPQELNDAPMPRPGLDLASAYRLWEAHCREADTRAKSVAGWFSVSAPDTTLVVCGGSEISWEALLVTCGTSRVATAGPLMVVNLSQRRLGRSLSDLLNGAGWRAVTHTLGTPLDGLSLCDQVLDGRAIANAIVTVLHRGAEHRRDEILEDQTILQEVAGALTPPVRLEAIVAGLSAVTMHGDGDSPHLSLEEQQRLQRLYNDRELQQSDVVQRLDRG